MPIEVEINGKVKRIPISNSETKTKEKVKLPFGSKKINSNKFYFSTSIK
jgi:hypothetical protein